MEDIGKEIQKEVSPISALLAPTEYKLCLGTDFRVRPDRKVCPLQGAPGRGPLYQVQEAFSSPRTSRHPGKLYQGRTS